MIIPSYLSVFEEIFELNRRSNIQAMSNNDMIKTNRHCTEYQKIKSC